MEFETELLPHRAVQRDRLTKMGEPVPSLPPVNTTEGSSQGEPGAASQEEQLLSMSRWAPRPSSEMSESAQAACPALLRGQPRDPGTPPCATLS